MTRRIVARLLIAASLALSGAWTAAAHETAKGPNGGSVVEAAGHHVEFVPSAGELTFHLSGAEGDPISSAGAKVKALIQLDGKTAQAELTPVEPDKLVVPLETALSSGAKVVVTGTLADGHQIQARFVVP